MVFKQSLSRNNERIDSMDIIRGICILLMIVDHFMFIILKFNPIKNSNNNNTWNSLSQLVYLFYTSESRKVLRVVVVSTLFIISGMCCYKSRNNVIRGLKLLLCADIITVLTYLISSLFTINIKVEFGVIHFYASAVFIWSILSRIKNITMRNAIIFIFLCFSMYVFLFNPKLNTNILLPIGIPSNQYIYYMEYFPIFPWISLFFLGALIGENVFDNMKKTIPISNTNRNIFLVLLRNIGQNGLKIYLIHLPIIIAIVEFVL